MVFNKPIKIYIISRTKREKIIIIPIIHTNVSEKKLTEDKFKVFRVF